MAMFGWVSTASPVCLFRRGWWRKACLLKKKNSGWRSVIPDITEPWNFCWRCPPPSVRITTNVVTKKFPHSSRTISVLWNGSSVRLIAASVSLQLLLGLPSIGIDPCFSSDLICAAQPCICPRHLFPATPSDALLFWWYYHERYM